ncbi:MAG: hypothetical protein V8R80_02495 [Eubacterium sp.]
MLALALPARNLALRQRRKAWDWTLAVPCASCYSRMKHTVVAARKDEAVRQQLEEIIGMPYKAKADVLNFLEIFSRPEMKRACQEKMYRTKRNESCLLLRMSYIQTGGGDRSFIYGKSHGNG